MTPNLEPDNPRRPARAMRVLRFISSETRAVRELRPQVGIRRALVHRIKANLELDRVDNAAFSTLATALDATRAQLDATRAELEATRAELATASPRADAAYSRLELDHVGTRSLAASPALEQIVGLGYWLSAQPASELPVSVIIPTRSRPAFVAQAVASVQAQTHAHWELIVVDDGSIDDTRATLAAIDDERIRCVRTEGLGPPAARNVGLEHATGEAIAYLDDDNIMLPGWLTAVAWAFTHFADVDVLYGARVVEDESAVGGDGLLPRLLFSPFDRDRLLEGNYIDASVIAHRAGLPQARWDPELTGIADWDLMIRLTAEKPALAMPALASLYRTSAPGRITHTETWAAAQRELQRRVAATQSEPPRPARGRAPRSPSRAS